MRKKDYVLTRARKRLYAHFARIERDGKSFEIGCVPEEQGISERHCPGVEEHVRQRMSGISTQRFFPVARFLQIFSAEV